MHNPQCVYNNDATLWAEEFMYYFQHNKDEIDYDLMLSWFACAIETGAHNNQKKSSNGR